MQLTTFFSPGSRRAADIFGPRCVANCRFAWDRQAKPQFIPMQIRADDAGQQPSLDQRNTGSFPAAARRAFSASVPAELAAGG